MKRSLCGRWVLIFNLLALVGWASGAFAITETSPLEEFLVTTPVDSWSGNTVDTTRDVGTYLDVAIRARTGAPYVSYYDQTGEDLWFARFVGTGGNCGPTDSWSCQLVESAGNAGMYNSIAVRETVTGTEVIIAYQNGPSLKYASGECDESSCLFTTYLIEAGAVGVVSVGLYTSVEFTTVGNAFISYQRLTNTNSGYAKIATGVPSGGNCGTGDVAGLWQCDTILSGTGLGSYTSVAVDGSDRPQVAFYDPETGYPYHAALTTSGGNCGPGGMWYCRSPYINTHDTGTSMSLFVESDGTPHLAYLDTTTTNDLLYVTYVGSTGNCGFSSITLQFEWQCDVIDEDLGPVGSARTVAIAGDASSEPVIAYRDSSSDFGPPVLRFAQPYHAAPAGAVPNCGPIDLIYTWSCTMLDNGGSNQEEAAAVAIASEYSGTAIAYHELDTYAFPEEGNLKAIVNTFPFFADGFETGDLRYWSLSAP